MANETVQYTTAEEKAAAVADAEGRGLTMLADDHGIDGKNRLTFRLQPEPVLPPEEIRRNELRTLMASGKATAADVRETLALLL